jgi:ribosomal protein L25 (general stress protein Ctc)
MDAKRVRALISQWRSQAEESREEAGRIRRTVYAATEAEANCNIRAEVWDSCANELESITENVLIGL